MDLPKDIDCKIKYHPGSSNLVADALSRKVYVCSLCTSSVARVVEECCSLEDGLFFLSGRVVVPVDSVLRDEILSQDHRSRNCDAIWVVVDRLPKSAHFLPYNRDSTFDMMACLHVQEVVRLHGITLSIVSDRDPRFTSSFWGIL
ncbi:uncharacterized protein [Henckelia pumila]|uniref:uncharacterized protein n=1 Tax=Henckelia pumila TaxID=405737 RepID=UPI003C6E2D5B